MYCRPGDRQEVRRADGGDARQRREARGQIPVEGRDLRALGIARARQPELRRQDPLRADARLDAEDGRHAPQEERGADEEHQRQRDLGDEHRLPRGAGSRALTGGTGRGAQRFVVGGRRRAQGWPEARDERGRQRDGERVEKHPRVDSDLRAAREGVAGERHERLGAPHGQHGPGRAPGERQRECLRQHLPEEAPAAGAESASDRDLPAPSRPAGKQQVGHVDAGDEEDERHRSEEKQQGFPRAAGDRFLQGHEHDAPARVLLRIGGGQPRGDRGEIRLRRGERHARLSPGDDGEPVGASVLERLRVQDERHPDVGLARGVAEVARHDAADGPALPVERDRAADDAGVPAETPLPELPGKNHAGLAAGVLVRGVEHAPEKRRDPEDREESGGDGIAAQVQGLALGRQRHVVAGERGHCRERRVLRPPVHEVGGRRAEPVEPPAGVAVPDPHELLGAARRPAASGPPRPRPRRPRC